MRKHLETNIPPNWLQLEDESEGAYTAREEKLGDMYARLGEKAFQKVIDYGRDWTVTLDINRPRHRA